MKKYLVWVKPQKQRKYVESYLRDTLRDAEAKMKEFLLMGLNSKIEVIDERELENA